MPLLPGKENIGHNIEEMQKAGHPHDQAVAAALNEADVPKSKNQESPLAQLLARMRHGRPER